MQTPAPLVRAPTPGAGAGERTERALDTPKRKRAVLVPSYLALFLGARQSSRRFPHHCDPLITREVGGVRPLRAEGG